MEGIIDDFLIEGLPNKARQTEKNPMTTIELVNHYYRNGIGHYPMNQKSVEKTRCTIEYLKDCGFTSGSIFDILGDCQSTEALDPEALPDKLWENSLIQRGHYYYHHALHIVSPPPVMQADGTLKVYPFSDELLIRFTLNDLVTYFYHTLGIDLMFREDKRDEAQMQSLLNRFRRYDPVEPLDMVLALIDEAKQSRVPVADPFGVASSDAVMLAYDKLKRNIAQSKLGKADRALWRQTSSKDT